MNDYFDTSEVEWVRAWAKAAWDLCLAQARLEQLRTARYADRSPGGMGKGMGPPGAPPMGMGPEPFCERFAP